MLLKFLIIFVLSYAVVILPVTEDNIVWAKKKKKRKNKKRKKSTKKNVRVIEKNVPINSSIEKPLDKARNTKKKLVKRQVLLLDFVNQKNVSNSNYLSLSIPEAFIHPLQKTKSFEVMSRDLSGRIVKKKKMKSSKLFSDDNAVILGKAAGADVVIIGNYIVIGNSIQIQAKAIDVFSGRVKVSQTATGKIDSSIFDTIKSLAKEMSADMKRELPPLTQKEIIKERIVFKEIEKDKKGGKTNISFHILGSFNLPQGQITDYFDNGFGGRLDVGAQLLLPWLHPYFQAGYQLGKGKESKYETNMMFAQGGLSYPISLSNALIISPYVAGGVTMGRLTTFFTNASVDAGGIIDWYFTRNVGFSISSSFSTIFDKKFMPYFIQMHAGFAVRF